jgi:pteridine reductase
MSNGAAANTGDPSSRGVALVTGAVKRVGLATALALARAGMDLIITYRSSAREAEDAAGALGALGAAVRVIELDLDDLAAVERVGSALASDLARAGRALDVLVHNASIYGPTPLASVTAEEALRHYRVNALAPLLLTRHLAAALGRSTRPGGGAVVAMADIHAMGEHGLPRRDFSAYAMSKAALVELVRTLARDLAPRVRVNAVAPGVVAWPDEGHESDAEAQQAYLKRVPLGRAGTPEDAAEAVRWLALDASYVTGEVVRLDGGRNLA